MLIQLDFSAVLASWPLLVRGVVWTIGLTIVGTVLGLLLGTACAGARARNLGHRPAPLRWAVASYVELVRKTPFIVQLFFLFFGLPALGLKLSLELHSGWLFAFAAFGLLWGTLRQLGLARGAKSV